MTVAPEDTAKEILRPKIAQVVRLKVAIDVDLQIRRIARERFEEVLSLWVSDHGFGDGSSGRLRYRKLPILSCGQVLQVGVPAGCSRCLTTVLSGLGT